MSTICLETICYLISLKMFIGQTLLWFELLLVVSFFNETISEQCITHKWCNLLRTLNIKCCSDEVISASNSIARLAPMTLPNTTSTDVNNSYTEFSCGRQSLLNNNKIVGGSETKFGEFPWLAIIFYAKYNGHECTGSVIQRNFILTAAHCLTGQILHTHGKPYKVRLGEHDLMTDPDCSLIENLCAPNAVEIQILNSFPHPKYQSNSRSSYDIGLIKLTEDIVFNNYIRPICFDLDFGLDLTGQWLFISGWGKTENGLKSYRKLKAAIPFVNITKCQQVYNNRNVRDDQICAGGDEGTDSCHGDSGSPLMLLKNYIWYAVGVVSVGHSTCGKRNHPALYTRTDMHIRWMRRKMNLTQFK